MKPAQFATMMLFALYSIKSSGNTEVPFWQSRHGVQRLVIAVETLLSEPDQLPGLTETKLSPVLRDLSVYSATSFNCQAGFRQCTVQWSNHWNTYTAVFIAAVGNMISAAKYVLALDKRTPDFSKLPGIGLMFLTTNTVVASLPYISPEDSYQKINLNQLAGSLANSHREVIACVYQSLFHYFYGQLLKVDLIQSNTSSDQQPMEQERLTPRQLEQFFSPLTNHSVKFADIPNKQLWNQLMSWLAMP